MNSSQQFRILQFKNLFTLAGFTFTSSKGTVFFFREKFVFCKILPIFEWVSKKGVFFFPRPKKKKQPSKLSKWVACKLFLGGKKKHSKMPKSAKIRLFFFPASREKKQHFFRFEWVSECVNFSAEKKNSTFDAIYLNYLFFCEFVSLFVCLFVRVSSRLKIKRI